MQVTLGNLYNGWQSLAKIANLDLPARKAYAFARFMKQAGTEFDLIDKQRIKLIEKYGEKDADGNISVTPNQMEAFVAELNDLMAESVEVYDPGLTVDDLDGVKLSAMSFFALSWLFDKPEADVDAPPPLTNGADTPQPIVN